ncbi:Ankyrin-3 [Penicillium subrubescens]|uniref:Ankyrin-3 n=1 Tax=Penicillium subrubescens TaxID=1316194 RepID=A0A1Q5U714_9EURO|nr:Ankyrin-3 [Penicillium subrubescens]
MSLNSLPAEILQQIGEYITSLSTLNAISRANCRFHLIFDPLLYAQDAQRTRGQSASAGGGAAAVRWAAQYGLMRTMQKSLEGGSEIPSRGPWMHVVHEPAGRTVYGVRVDWRFRDPVPPPHPLCLAAQGGHVDIIEFLLDVKGCDVNVTDQRGLSLLEIAVVHGHVQLAEGLLRRGANQLSGRQLTGSLAKVVSSPMQLAVLLGKLDMMRLLWDYGVRVNIGGPHRNSTGPLELAARIGDVELVELFLSAGARPRYAVSDTECALVQAVMRRDEKIASLVISDSTCMQKTIALTLAASQEDRQLARFLLARGTHPDFDDLEYSDVHCPKGYADTWHFASPLAHTVNEGHAHLVQLLVESGADVNVPFEGFEKSKSSRQTGSVLQLAMELGNRDIVSFLRENGAQEEWRNGYAGAPSGGSKSDPNASPHA